MTAEERREAARDRGVALELAAEELSRASPPLARLAAAQAVPLLEAAVRDRSDDLPARESLGYSLGMLDRLAEARHAYEEVLRIEPRRESALPYLARTLAGLRRPGLAAEALREAIAVNPWGSDYRLALARHCAQAGDWPGVVAACREAIRLNPELIEARSLLVRGLPGLRRAGEGRRRVPDPAQVRPPESRPLAATVRAAEAGGTGRRGPRLELKPAFGRLRRLAQPRRIREN